MDQPLKAEWLTHLETAPKTKGRLKDEYGFCCLGVLADILEPEGWEAPSPDGVIDHELFDHAGQRFGSREGIADLSEEHRYKLIKLNDVSDTFAPIIEYIKENL